MKIVKFVGVVAVLLIATAGPVNAQDKSTKDSGGLTTSVFSGAALAAGLGMALTIIGAGYGLGRIGAAAVESIARQPEAAPKIQTAMIIIAAMLEGATLASVVFCFLLGGYAKF